MQTPGESDNVASAAACATPLISIVIPVYNAADYLTGCLDSVTGQSFGDIEIIAVNGGSTDESADILDERATREPRLAVVHTNIRGPGRARNVGAAEASGRYLWFVDADDGIMPGCLAPIAEHLASAAPDVLLIDYELANRDGTLERSPDRAVLGQDLPPSFTLAEQPWAIDLTMASWNKVIRTEYFRSSGAAFAEDWPHEDIGVTCRLMLEARKISVLDLACYRYRRDAPSSLMAAGELRRHFRAFDVWDAVLDQVRKRADSNDPVVTRAVYSAFFQRAILHLSHLLDGRVQRPGLLSSGRYVARGIRREFFGNMHWIYLNYRPTAYQRPDGPRGLKFRMIEKGSYAGYCALLWLSRLRAAARRGVRWLRPGRPRW